MILGWSKENICLYWSTYLILFKKSLSCFFALTNCLEYSSWGFICSLVLFSWILCFRETCYKSLPKLIINPGSTKCAEVIIKHTKNLLSLDLSKSNQQLTQPWIFSNISCLALNSSRTLTRWKDLSSMPQYDSGQPNVFQGHKTPIYDVNSTKTVTIETNH